MNKRTLSIIHELNRPEKEITISDLADDYNISQRAIRNDLNTINEVLRENGLAELQLKSGGRIIRDSGFENILTYVSDGDFYSYKLSREERRNIAWGWYLRGTGGRYGTYRRIRQNGCG